MYEDLLSSLSLRVRLELLEALTVDHEGFRESLQENINSVEFNYAIIKKKDAMVE